MVHTEKFSEKIEHNTASFFPSPAWKTGGNQYSVVFLGYGLE
jgi:hypothetical protein